jgi:hypothetical protein
MGWAAYRYFPGFSPCVGFQKTGCWPVGIGLIVKKTGVSPLFSKDRIEAADKLTETMNKPCEQQ